MPRHVLRVTLTVLGSATLGSMAIAGHAAGSHPCASITEDVARLACYDQAFGRNGSRPSPAPVENTAVAVGAITASPPASGAAAAAPATTTAVDAQKKMEDEFGLSDPAKRARAPTPAEALPAEPEHITGRVASIGYRTTGQLVVTLDSGQTWTQIESVTQARFKPGDEVTIKKAALGSFLMVGSQRVAMRVRRIK
jgi:hypothetical protein